MLTVLTLADLHFHHPSGHTGPPDPVITAFVVTLFVGLGISVLAGVLSGGLLMVFTRRIRDMFWAIPLANVAMYALFLATRSYPGGRSAQFRGGGLVDTLLGLILLLIVSLAMATILALIRRLGRAMRGKTTSPPKVGNPAGAPARIE